MLRFRIARVLAAALMGALIITPVASDAQGHYVSIVRDGMYAGQESGYQELAYFYIHGHRLYHLRFRLLLSCHNTRDGTDYQRNFTAGPSMPQGRAIPSNGTLQINWTETDAGRRGRINGELSFHRHWLASFSVIANGGLESCTGFSAVRVHRSPGNPPVPSFS